jgi:serine/threonine-protein kinase
MIGQVLDGRYKIIQTLGAGGFGHTYIAEDLRIPGNPKCVVKQLKPAGNDPNLLTTARRLFQSEAESLAQLGNHDQIPRILAFFEENQEFFLVQEFIDGRPLTDELTPGKRLSESYVIALLKGLLPVLEFIHQQDVIHRDIKPANIIRRKQDSKLVLIDFGAVKQVRAVAATVQGEQSRATVSIGTPGYMPTEQGRGKPRPNSDIYALGMIGIQALIGLYPGDLEEDSRTGEILWQHHGSVSPGLADVLTKMVRYHFKDRYQSATEALQALYQLENPAPAATVLPTSRGYKPTEAVTEAGENSTAATQVHELSLEWVEAGHRRTQIIRDQQPSKNPGTVRIGRDPAQCDIVLSEPSVSGLHVEIFYNRQQQSFYLRPLRESNPPVVNGITIPRGEVMLDQGSSLRLGQLDLRVTAIALKQYSPGYKLTEHATQPLNSSHYPIPPTIQPIKGEDIEVTLEISPEEATSFASKEITFTRTVYVNGSPQQETKKLTVNITPGSHDGTRLQFLGQGHEGLYGGSAGDVYVRLVVRREAQPPAPPPILDDSRLVPPEPPKRKFPSWLARGLTTATVIAVSAFIKANWNSNPLRSTDDPPPEQCRVVSPTKGGTTAKVRSQPLREAETVVNLNKGDRVAYIEAANSFVKVKLSNGTEGWVFNDQIRPCNASALTNETVSPAPNFNRSSTSSTSSSDSKNDAKTAYRKGFKIGTARGQEVGKTDGEANGGRGTMHIDAACSEDGINEVTNAQDYIRGYREGCEKAYKEAFGIASQEAISKQTRIDDCFAANENLSSAQREAKCGCQPGYYYDHDQSGCFPVQSNERRKTNPEPTPEAQPSNDGRKTNPEPTPEVQPSTNY